MRTGGVAGSVIARSVVARSVVGVAVVVGLAAQTACALAPSTAGKPCASDLDCPGPFYCQLEVEPRVCLPGDFVLPERSNRAPVLVEGLVVARAGEGPVEGRFRAVDIEGAAARFSPGDPIETEVGTLIVLDEQGAFRFEPRDLVENGEAEVLLSLRDDDPIRPATESARARLVVLAQEPSPGFAVWTGAAGADFLDDGSWAPPGTAPDEDVSVLVRAVEGPAPVLPARALASTAAYFSTNDAALTLGEEPPFATLVTHGARVLSAGAIDDGVVEIDADPALARAIELGGRFPTLRVRHPVRLVAPVHARGDLGFSADTGALDVGATALWVEGDLVRAAGAAPLVMASPSARVVVRGDLLLAERGGADRLDEGVLAVAGDLRAEGASFRPSPDLRVLLVGDQAVQRVALGDPGLSFFQDLEVRAGATVSFASSARVRRSLVLGGTVGVEAGRVVEAEDLLLRPAYAPLPGATGLIRAKRCVRAPRVAVPDVVECGAVLDEVQLADGGVEIEPGPDAGYEPLPACAPGADERVLHHVVVAPSDLPGIDAVHGEVVLVAPAAMRPLDRVEPAGTLHLDETGRVSFSPGGLAGEIAAPFSYEMPLPTLDGSPPSSFVTGSSCLLVRVVETAGMNTLIGRDWHDPNAWSFGRVPTEDDAVYLPAAPRVDAEGPPLFARELWVQSGVRVDTGGSDLFVHERVVVGGELVTGAGAVRVKGELQEAAGRIERLACGPGRGLVSTGLMLGSLVAEPDAAYCGFEVDRARLSVASDVALDVPLRLHMQGDDGFAMFAGALRVPALSGTMTHGLLSVAGELDVGSWDGVDAAQPHRLLLMHDGLLRVPRVDYGGQLTVTASDAPLVVEGGGAVGALMALRAVESLDAPLRVDELIVMSGFQAIGQWEVGRCFPTGSVPVPDVCPAE